MTMTKHRAATLIKKAAKAIKKEIEEGSWMLSEPTRAKIISDKIMEIHQIADDMDARTGKPDPRLRKRKRKTTRRKTTK